jgi:hypothetical protein
MLFDILEKKLKKLLFIVNGNGEVRGFISKEDRKYPWLFLYNCIMTLLLTLLGKI